MLEQMQICASEVVPGADSILLSQVQSLLPFVAVCICPNRELPAQSPPPVPLKLVD